MEPESRTPTVHGGKATEAAVIGDDAVVLAQSTQIGEIGQASETALRLDRIVLEAGFQIDTGTTTDLIEAHVAEASHRTVKAR